MFMVNDVGTTQEEGNFPSPLNSPPPGLGFLAGLGTRAQTGCLHFKGSPSQPLISRWGWGSSHSPRFSGVLIYEWKQCPSGAGSTMICDYYTFASLVAQMVENPPAMQETWVQLLGQEDCRVIYRWGKWSPKPLTVLSKATSQLIGEHFRGRAA